MSDEPTARRITVLVVDDDEDLRSVIGRVLEANGFAVLAAADLDTARALRARASVDLVLTDVTLADGSGSALDGRMDATAPTGPVLYMSGHLGTHLEDAGVLPPGATLLGKPFGADALLGAVRRALDVDA